MIWYSDVMDRDMKHIDSRTLRLAQYRRLKANPAHFEAVKARAEHSKQVFDAATRIMRGQTTAEDRKNPEVSELLAAMAE